MERLYKIWKSLSPIDKFFYAQEYWKSVNSPNMWYGMNEIDTKLKGYKPIDVLSILQPKEFDIRDSFFRYNEQHLLVSGNAEDVMKDINSDIDKIIEFNADEL